MRASLRTRRVKCDEGKPECVQCLKSCCSCGGYDVSRARKPKKTRTKAPYFFVHNQVLSPLLGALPSFLTIDKYQNPANIEHSAYQVGLHTSDNVFAFLQSRPEDGANFNYHMIG
jgi:hypothetical protein